MDRDELQNRIRQERERIAQQRSVLSAKIEELTQQQERLQDEESELLIAENVFAKLSEPEQAHTVINVTTSNLVPKGTKGSRKPAHLPPIPEMVNLVLMAAEKEGEFELRPKAILKRIAAEWWPDVQLSDIIPPMARLAKSGKLLRNEEKRTYSRAPQINAPRILNGAGE